MVAWPSPKETPIRQKETAFPLSCHRNAGAAISGGKTDPASG
jgi:hypothetical protein